MALITLDQVRKSFGVFQVLDEVTFTIGAGEKVALVGPNGSGKTTILRMIMGNEYPDTGSCVLIPGTSIGYMRQDNKLDGSRTLVEEVSNASEEVLHLERELRRLETAMGAVEGDDLNTLLEEYGEVQHEFDRLGGYSFEAEVKETLSGLGLGPDHWEKQVGILSGGQKTRAALAKLLLQKPDLLLLDEPTNHLDIEACEWLEEFLVEFSGAVLVVSHDRYFLDRVVTKIIDLHEGCTKQYPGNYTTYAKQKYDFLRQQLENYERQQQEIGNLQDFIARYHAGQRHQEAKSRQKKLDKMVRIQKPHLENQKMRMKIDSATTSGHIVMDVQGLAKSFDDKPLFSSVDFLIEKGDRVGLVGPNGAGKTTLMRILIGDEAPSAGTVSLGYAVQIGYFAQDLSDLDPMNNVLEELLEAGELTPGEARSLLAKFLFTGEDVFRSVSKLSGGERNRLTLAKLMLQRPNVLMLDEPTNHLDIDSRQALDEALKTFDGTVILTSHDRYLLNSIATKIVEVSQGTSRTYVGNYDYFMDRSKRFKPRPVKRKPKPVAKTTKSSGPKGPTAADYERDIETAETRLGELTDLLGLPETYADGEKAAATQAEYHELSGRIEELYASWEALISEQDS